MDMQKEREAFEDWFSKEFSCDEWEYNPFSRMEFNDIDAYSCSTVNAVWSAWQAAKVESHKQAALYQSEINHLAQANQQWREKAAQAIPEGFVVVPKEPTQELLNKMQDYFVGSFENGLTGGQSIHCAYIAMIEAQEQAND